MGQSCHGLSRRQKQTRNFPTHRPPKFALLKHFLLANISIHLADIFRRGNVVFVLSLFSFPRHFSLSLRASTRTAGAYEGYHFYFGSFSSTQKQRNRCREKENFMIIKHTTCFSFFFLLVRSRAREPTFLQPK